MTYCLMGFNQFQILFFWSSNGPITEQWQLLPLGSSWVLLTGPTWSSIASSPVTGKMYWFILNISCPRPRISQFSGKPLFLSVINGISRPQSGIHADISNSNSGQFFPLTYLLIFFCITAVFPFFHIENSGLKDTRYKGLHYSITIHFLYPTSFI